jgi:hypothetical protein
MCPIVLKLLRNFVSLGEEGRRKGFGRKVLRMFGPMKRKATGGWKSAKQITSLHYDLLGILLSVLEGVKKDREKEV